MSNIIQEVKEFVENECKKSTSKYGYGPFVNHFVPMRDYAVMLAEKLNADKEIVEIAAWLHDIGSIIRGRQNHHATGAEIAEKKLKELKYPEDKIDKVKKCILNHRGSVQAFRESTEEKIIADADAMSAYDNLPGMFMAAYIYENKEQEEAKISVRNKLANSYAKLLPESQKIMKQKYEAAMLLLK